MDAVVCVNYIANKLNKYLVHDKSFILFLTLRALMSHILCDISPLRGSVCITKHNPCNWCQAQAGPLRG